MRLLVVLGLLATSGLSGCGASNADSSSTIYASFYPLQYVAQRIAGDGYTVDNLTKPGQEPHDTELSIKQSAALSDARIVFYEKGLASFVDDAVDSANPPHVVDASAAADLEGDDPHFWLDPIRLSSVAVEFEGELAKADPGDAATFETNLAALQRDLAELDRDLSAGLATCRIRTVVVSHDAFEYFGARYGLDLVSINGLSPQAEPSPAHISQLHDLIERDHITTVFNEELASAKMADVLAHDLGLRTAVLDPIEGLSDETAGQDYLTLMRANLAALQRSNGCS